MLLSAINFVLLARLCYLYYMLLLVPDSVITAYYLISFAILLFHVPKLMYMTWYNEIITLNHVDNES